MQFTNIIWVAIGVLERIRTKTKLNECKLHKIHLFVSSSLVHTTEMARCIWNVTDDISIIMQYVIQCNRNESFAKFCQ